MGFRKGCMPWNKNGGNYSKKAKKNMSLGQKKRFKKESAWNKGKPLSRETKEKLSKALKGRKAWNKGKKVLQWSGKNHRLWKGDKVGYRAIHNWVVRYKGQPDTCEHCKKSGFSGREIHWASISRKYKRDLDDWLRLCTQCHGKFDTGKKKRRM